MVSQMLQYDVKRVVVDDTLCRVDFELYAASWHNGGGNLALRLVDDITGEPYITVSVNPGFRLPDNVIAVRGYSQEVYEPSVHSLIGAGVLGYRFQCLPINNSHNVCWLHRVKLPVVRQ